MLHYLLFELHSTRQKCDVWTGPKRQNFIFVTNWKWSGRMTHGPRRTSPQTNTENTDMVYFQWLPTSSTSISLAFLTFALSPRSQWDFGIVINISLKTLTVSKNISVRLFYHYNKMHFIQQPSQKRVMFPFSACLKII